MKCQRIWKHSFNVRFFSQLVKVVVSGITGCSFKNNCSASASNCLRRSLFTDKLCVPSTEAQVNRPRLIEHLQKSSAQFSATLITGRTGMGKTTLAAEFEKQSDYQLACYKVEKKRTVLEMELCAFC